MPILEVNAPNVGIDLLNQNSITAADIGHTQRIIVLKTAILVPRLCLLIIYESRIFSGGNS